MKIPVALLLRVSCSEKQTTDRQKSELLAYAESKGFSVVEVVEEKISGRASANERTGLKRIEELAESGAIKKVLVHEVSRIARSNSILHRFVENLEAHSCSLYWHSQAIETLLPNGKRNPAASIMLSLLSEMAVAEVELLRERINSGLAQARRKGVVLGRPKGSTLSSGDLLAKHSDIVRLLKQGQSIRNAGKITGKGFSTVQRVKKILDQHQVALAA
ncbi:MAG: recombinase family protein [Spartobacteria bacterium]